MFTKTRYYFELISLPIFVLLAIHLASAGIEKLLSTQTHDHLHNESIFSLHTVAALIIVFLFTWIWHQKSFKKWVPCSHEHCHDEQITSHIIATIALCAHFFPEAEIRHALFIAQSNQTFDIVILIGFAAHFIVDIIVAIFISSFWDKRWQFWTSLATITVIWIATTIIASQRYGDLLSNGWVLLLSSFLLAMFIHKPHKPAQHCHDCEH